MTVDLSTLKVGDTVITRGYEATVTAVELTPNASPDWPERPYTLTFSGVMRMTYKANGTYAAGDFEHMSDIVAIHPAAKPQPKEQSMFDKVGFYKTRDGRIVEVVTVVDPRLGFSSPLLGFIDGILSAAWGSSGYVFGAGNPLSTDLVEYLGPTKPKQKRMVTKTVERWVNVYHTFISKAYKTPAEAAAGAMDHRITCVKLTGTYEVEEEVDE